MYPDCKTTHKGFEEKNREKGFDLKMGSIWHTRSMSTPLVIYINVWILRVEKNLLKSKRIDVTNINKIEFWKTYLPEGTKMMEF